MCLLFVNRKVYVREAVLNSLCFIIVDYFFPSTPTTIIHRGFNISIFWSLFFFLSCWVLGLCEMANLNIWNYWKVLQFQEFKHSYWPQPPYPPLSFVPPASPWACFRPVLSSPESLCCPSPFGFTGLPPHPTRLYSIHLNPWVASLTLQILIHFTAVLSILTILHPVPGAPDHCTALTPVHGTVAGEVMKLCWELHSHVRPCQSPFEFPLIPEGTLLAFTIFTWKVAHLLKPPFPFL